METSKLILVIGATGAQGQAVIDAVLAPDAEERPSSYAIRALTRDPTNAFSQELAKRGVEVVKGSFMDFDSVARALEGAYGVWVNTDGFTVGEAAEIYAGMRIYEVAKRVPSLRHYVWSNLPYVLKNGGFNPDYAADHMNAKGRVGEWLNVQPSGLGEELTWSQVTTGPYMDTLNAGLFGPLNVRKDGTVVFASPLEDGHVPLIALKDIGWWARYTFDHRAETSGRDLNITSERVHWDDLVKTFTKVTGLPAVYKRLSIEEYFSVFEAEKLEAPLASDKRRGDGSKTVGDNFKAFLRVLRDDIMDKDMEWIRSVHPGTYTLERWMRETGYDGKAGSVLKNTLEGKMEFGYRKEVASLL
ncbi:NAD(P)-binding protein [Mycena albidolilacea]|uniref:NAD(P)-binding protein n=1 Tax=Mycena albidolilacea TaxID=1033008 RepID=A0AAD6YX07_9AGAR|nr:NAD(P)-binding protein [Mycena albidolilacea]